MRHPMPGVATAGSRCDGCTGVEVSTDKHRCGVDPYSCVRQKCRTHPMMDMPHVSGAALRMRVLSDLRPRERASEPSHNVLASTLLPQREFMEATFKAT